MAKHPALPASRVRWFFGGMWVLSAITLGLVLWLVSAHYSDQSDRKDLRERVSALSTLGAQNQAKIKQFGERPVGPPAASVAAGKATPPPTDIAPITPGPTTTITIAPTAGQIRTAVDQYFRVHPVKTPTVDPQALAPQVTAFVTTYLRQHPPPAGKNGSNGRNGSNGANGVDGSPGPTGSPGPPPSDQQIESAVSAYLPQAVADYLTANPPPAGQVGPSGPAGPAGPSGPAGPPGADGQNATPEQVANAVADYIDSHGIPCPDGTHPSDVPVPGQNPLQPGPTIRGCVVDSATPG